jgi:serine/threonine protein kinase
LPDIKTTHLVHSQQLTLLLPATYPSSACVLLLDSAIKDSILRCRYNFDDPIWDTISSDAKDFISKCLELDPSKRLTITQALRHRWFSRWLSLTATPDLSIPEEDQGRLRYVVNAAAFKGKAMNVSEQNTRCAELCFAR